MRGEEREAAQRGEGGERAQGNHSTTALMEGCEGTSRHEGCEGNHSTTALTEGCEGTSRHEGCEGNHSTTALMECSAPHDINMA